MTDRLAQAVARYRAAYLAIKAVEDARDAARKALREAEARLEAARVSADVVNEHDEALHDLMLAAREAK